MNRSFHWYLISKFGPILSKFWLIRLHVPKTKKLLNYAQLAENYVPSVSNLFLAVSVPTGQKRFKKEDSVQNAIFPLINDWRQRVNTLVVFS